MKDGAFAKERFYVLCCQMHMSGRYFYLYQTRLSVTCLISLSIDSSCLSLLTIFSCQILAHDNVHSAGHPVQLFYDILS